jgi:hypothetical protein
MKSNDEIIRIELDTGDAVAETIYNNLFARSADGRFCVWKDTPYQAPETENGFIARLCMNAAKEIRQLGF